MIRRYNDRLKTCQVGPWWLRFTWSEGFPPGAGYVLYAFRRRVLFRPTSADVLAGNTAWAAYK